MSSSNYIASPVQNPDQNDLEGFVSYNVPQVGDHVEACESEAQAGSGGSMQHLWDSHQLPERRATLLPAPVAASIMPRSPSFLLSPLAIPPFYGEEVTLSIYTVLQRSHASADRWVGLGGDRLEGSSVRSGKALNQGGGQGRRETGSMASQPAFHRVEGIPGIWNFRR